MLFPLSDGVGVMFFRGMVLGFFGGLVLILLSYGAAETTVRLRRQTDWLRVLFGWSRDRHRLNRCVPWLECAARLGAPHDRPIETRRRFNGMFRNRSERN